MAAGGGNIVVIMTKLQHGDLPGQRPTCRIKVKRDVIVHQIKARLELEMGLDRYEQMLMFGGRIVEDEDSTPLLDPALDEIIAEAGEAGLRMTVMERKPKIPPFCERESLEVVTQAFPTKATALHRAARRCDLFTMEELVSEKQTIATKKPPHTPFTAFDAKDNRGQSALHIAVTCNFREVADYLLKCPRFTAVGMKDQDGKTALHYAAFWGEFGGAQPKGGAYFIKKILAHKLFTKKDAQAKDKNGYSALMYATHNGLDEEAAAILEVYPDLPKVKPLFTQSSWGAPDPNKIRDERLDDIDPWIDIKPKSGAQVHAERLALETPPPEPEEIEEEETETCPKALKAARVAERKRIKAEEAAEKLAHAPHNEIRSTWADTRLRKRIADDKELLKVLYAAIDAGDEEGIEEALIKVRMMDEKEQEEHVQKGEAKLEELRAMTPEERAELYPEQAAKEAEAEAAAAAAKKAEEERLAQAANAAVERAEKAIRAEEERIRVEEERRRAEEERIAGEAAGAKEQEEFGTCAGAEVWEPPAPEPPVPPVAPEPEPTDPDLVRLANIGSRPATAAEPAPGYPPETAPLPVEPAPAPEPLPTAPEPPTEPAAEEKPRITGALTAVVGEAYSEDPKPSVDPWKIP